MSSYGTDRLTFFTIGFGDDWRHYNEYSYAQTVARHTQAELVEVRATPDDVLALLQTTYAEACDDPNADPVCPLAFFLAQQMRRQGFKVALSGEGADEVFLGYERYLLELSSWATLRSRGT